MGMNLKNSKNKLWEVMFNFLQSPIVLWSSGALLRCESCDIQKTVNVLVHRENGQIWNRQETKTTAKTAQKTSSVQWNKNTFGLSY